ncbi:MAG TPA: ATP-dependent DNA helicase RecG [Candidatus Kapabacteria bacterium]|nr:ATP-dependent DNA helicase RecG [Candidatus Kapabacteria bacterium]
MPNIANMQLTTSVAELNRVGHMMASRLRHLGIVTVRDLLFYFPFRYEDYSHVASIKNIKEGEQVTIRGSIELIANKRSPRKRTVITEAVVADATDRIRLVWFGQPFIAKNLKAGDVANFSGKVSSDMFGMHMVSPAYEKEGRGETTHTARIVPLYSLTSGITQKQLRFVMSQVIHLADTIEEWLPEDIQEAADLMPYGEALRNIHFPEGEDALRHAERRLKFDELFLLQLRAEMIRQSLKRLHAPMIPFHEEEIKTFVSTLPFTLTKDQKVSAWEILKDMERSVPMNRLLEGDVGSGKTAVAALVSYNATLSEYQVAVMAPTDILAKQHYETLTTLLGKTVTLGILTRTDARVSGTLVSSSRKASKDALISAIQDGTIAIVVGTHALLGDQVQFKKLGLVVVDEQHRFGVEQRKMIREKSGLQDEAPHFLSMTATPIPRSFALTLYGDLDLSIIRQMPTGRKPIKTRLVEPHVRHKAYDFIRAQVREGRQAFVICPLIEEGAGSGEKKTVMAEYEKLSQHIFSDLRVGYLHGKMKTTEKDEAMKQFAHHETDILVSTSVVEVGVNIPNASIMMIEGAETFGLAQLHQFRGRVGRSSHQSYCLLFTDSDSETVRERLSFFEKTTDGFALAEYDLESRGPGDVYGTAQSGMMALRLATMKDVDLIKLARELARGIDFNTYPVLKEKVSAWEKHVHLE